MKNFFKKLFAKKEDDVQSSTQEYFREDNVFAHSELVGDKKLVRMQSGKIYLAEIVEINNTAHHGADDTGIRDLVWKVLDVVQVIEHTEDRTKEIYAPKYGSIYLTAEMVVQAKYKDMWDIANDAFVRKFFPEQFKSFRFLRG